MLKLLLILLNGIVLFLISGCHNKTSNSRSEINLEYANCADSLHPYETFINCIEPGETIVKEIRIKGRNSIEQKNENIKVSFLLHHPYITEEFLNTEITNNTGDTIFYINDTFLRYKQNDDAWIPLIYPDNYVKNDIGYLIPSQESINLKLYLPLQKEYYKDKYKLQLTFCNATKDVYYYIDKIFLFRKTK